MFPRVETTWSFPAAREKHQLILMVPRRRFDVARHIATPCAALRSRLDNADASHHYLAVAVLPGGGAARSRLRLPPPSPHYPP